MTAKQQRVIEEMTKDFSSQEKKKFLEILEIKKDPEGKSNIVDCTDSEIEKYLPVLKKIRAVINGEVAAMTAKILREAKTM